MYVFSRTFFHIRDSIQGRQKNMAMASRLGTNGVCEFEKKKKVLRTPLRTSIHSPNAALAYGNDVRGGDALIWTNSNRLVRM